MPEKTGLVDSIFRVQELADYIVPFAIRVVCDLGIADHLVDGPRPVEELAAATGAHAPSLQRTLRALACKGIFAVIERAGVADRCEVVAGSFFDTMPEGADAYVLKRVLYDWGDEEAAALLAKIRDAMRNDSTLLVLDPVIEPGNDFDPGKIYDLLSMTMLGGRARSRDELTELFSASGFELTQVIQTDMFPVVEGRPSAARRAPVGAGARASDES